MKRLPVCSTASVLRSRPGGPRQPSALPGASVLLAAVCLAWTVVGCGEDDSGAGDGAKAAADTAAATDAGALQDGASGPDAAPADAGMSDAGAVDVDLAGDAGAADAGPVDTGSTANADTGAGPGDATGNLCGNGVCDAPAETLLTCAVDCAGGANCGDGKCDGAQENAFTCKKDCEVTADKAVPCIMGGCTTDVVACLKAPECAKTLGCVQKCGSDMGCLTGCGTNTSTDTQQKLGAVVLCGVQKGCFGVGGDGGQCGNGKCEGPTENPVTCVKDCPAPVCGNGTCEPPLESYLVCNKDCTKPVCGNGTCEPPFESALLCAQDCKPKTCGDGKCDKDGGETTSNCFEDCKPGSAQSNCIATKCVKENLACAGDLKCLGAATCTGSCGDKACFDSCGKDLPAGSAKLFQAVADCGTQNSCFQ